MSTTIKDHEIVELDINDIKEDKSNPNTMTLEQSRGLEKSLLNFGRLKYIVVDQNNILIDGYHRWEIEKANGTNVIDVIKVNVDNESERKMMRETLNRLHGEYDPKKESDELLFLYQDNKLGDLAELLGKPQTDLQDLLKEYHKDMDFDFDTKYNDENDKTIENIFKQYKKIVKKGDMWRLGRHILLCGNSTIKENIDKLLSMNESTHITMVFTDPPYNVGFKYKEYDDDKLDPTRYNLFCLTWFKHIVLEYIIPDVLIFTPGPKNDIIYRNILEPQDIGIWYKYNSMSGASLFYYRKCEPILFYKLNPDFKFSERRANDFFKFETSNFKELHQMQEENNINDDNHAPAKPLDLVIDIIETYSKQKDIIVDLFLGSGTTLIAAEKTGRTCYGIELDENYCSVILERYYQLTNIDPQRVSDNKLYSELKREKYEE